jgi:hypothetical protein
MNAWWWTRWYLVWKAKRTMERIRSRYSPLRGSASDRGEWFMLLGAIKLTTSFPCNIGSTLNLSEYKISSSLHSQVGRWEAFGMLGCSRSGIQDRPGDSHLFKNSGQFQRCFQIPKCHGRQCQRVDVPFVTPWIRGWEDTKRSLDWRFKTDGSLF